MPTPGAFVFGISKAPLPWLLAGAVIGYLLLMFTNPVSSALRDGWRAVRRYPALWLAFGAFGFANTLFQFVIRIYSYFVLPAGDRPVFMWLRAAWRDPQFWFTGSPESFWYVPPHGLRDAARDAVLPAVESVAGIFNNLVSTFPLASVAAVLLLMNWDGHQMVLQRALRQRFKLWGWFAYAGILLGALAVIAKVLLYAAPPILQLEGSSALLWFQWSPVVVWIAFLFEYFFGVCIQIYLILLAYCWVRGITFDHPRLLDFAIRRFAFVLKWAAVVVTVSSLFLDLPLILKNFTPFQAWFMVDDATLDFRVWVARSVLAGFLLIFPTMQITLTFHNESIIKALHDHRQFLRRHWWRFGWFLIVAGVHFYLFVALNLVCGRALGDGTAPGIVWAFVAPWLNGVVGAWLLASWVCVFRNCDHARAHEEWIKF
ncbi:MAG: hypothetical protein WCF18_07880 [Chthoniobacteraceae bacterium]